VFFSLSALASEIKEIEMILIITIEAVLFLPLLWMCIGGGR